MWWSILALWVFYSSKVPLLWLQVNLSFPWYVCKSFPRWKWTSLHAVLLDSSLPMPFIISGVNQPGWSFHINFQLRKDYTRHWDQSADLVTICALQDHLLSWLLMFSPGTDSLFGQKSLRYGIVWSLVYVPWRLPWQQEVLIWPTDGDLRCKTFLVPRNFQDSIPIVFADQEPLGISLCERSLDIITFKYFVVHIFFTLLHFVTGWGIT